MLNLIIFNVQLGISLYSIRYRGFAASRIFYSSILQKKKKNYRENTLKKKHFFVNLEKIYSKKLQLKYLSKTNCAYVPRTLDIRFHDFVSFCNTHRNNIHHHRHNTMLTQTFYSPYITHYVLLLYVYS